MQHDARAAAEAAGIGDEALNAWCHVAEEEATVRKVAHVRAQLERDDAALMRRRRALEPSGCHELGSHCGAVEAADEIRERRHARGEVDAVDGHHGATLDGTGRREERERRERLVECEVERRHALGELVPIERHLERGESGRAKGGHDALEALGADPARVRERSRRCRGEAAHGIEAVDKALA